MADFGNWRVQIEAGRAEKDRFLAMHPQSPIPVHQRHGFKGLQYYPPDLRYRFELELHEHDRKETIEVQDTRGNMRRLLRWGEFRFEIDGKQCTLQAYKDDPEDERLFIPFRDQTSGKETYGAGRYLDLEPEKHLTAKGKWIIDFNKAYNPWCAYSKDYACPFVPPENWLKVPVRAGEKNYSAGEA